MAELLFYENPVPLNTHDHRKLRIRPDVAGFRFAAKARGVLLAGIEFLEASKEYPIVFAKSADGKLAGVAVLGLRENENLFVADDGKWDARYIPAFVRRYPFVLAEGEPDQQLTVCIDRAYSGLNTEDGELLIDGKGKPTKKLQGIMAFLEDFQGQYRRTEMLVAKLQEYDLLQDMTAQVVLPTGEQMAMQGLLVVSEQKLQELDDAKALTLYREGFLPWIWAHLGSLSNFNRLMERLATRQSQAQKAQEASLH